ncbi:hypothetical protein [Haladaptatus sp. AB643]|nr:hypothetical protein [Haladaptatus sp. AB643]MCO8244783.1 hypothetical protein [Haladaptatus sp. AB643]MCO8255705.1 hypothetical protein [Haladaptatus sp. AB618]
MGSQNETETDDGDDDHLEDIGDGIGCVEIWEHLSDQREDDSKQSE